MNSKFLNFFCNQLVIVHFRVNHYADWHGGCMFYLEWHLAHRLVSPLNSCLIIRSDNENISIL